MCLGMTDAEGMMHVFFSSNKCALYSDSSVPVLVPVMEILRVGIGYEYRTEEMLRSSFFKVSIS